ncbi:citrate lyase acyl carrier protein [Petroclostridium sp. X23]|uniref:citrate lyase acyl carrier protein n=1 Tax=Petroclostridium sp. X23 TaxID=3045146 RepID=UPI0024AD6947|nr:citrate lyase acyl carrier protein [Petroclostridium sp. X23]WHH57840.1 citrate lyase acyl carrier protein [Petroclostridium sp. X23]
MIINKMVMAGSLESNDALITLGPPKGEGIELTVESIVEKQFGDKIRKNIREVLADFDITNAYIRVQDKGALDCTLKARMETAILRSKGEE